MQLLQSSGIPCHEEYGTISGLEPHLASGGDVVVAVDSAPADHPGMPGAGAILLPITLGGTAAANQGPGSRA